MTAAERQTLAQKLFTCAAFFGKKDLDSSQLKITVDLLVQYFPKPLEVYLSAIDAYMQDSKNKFFPAPVQLRPYLEPEMDQRDIALTLTRQLIVAIKSHQDGWTTGYFSVHGQHWLYKNKSYASWNEAALAELGELGVTVINRYGWKNLCDSYFEADETTFNAQMRDYILATQRLAAIGHLNTKFALVESKPRETTGYLPINMLPEKDGPA